MVTMLLWLLSIAFVDPDKRFRGWPSYIGLLTLLICTIANGLDKLDVINL